MADPDRSTEPEGGHAVCPATRVLDLVAHKWTVTILHHLQTPRGRSGSGSSRGSPADHPEGADQAAPRAGTLGAGLGEIFAEVPPRVEYRLTDLGATLIPALAGLHEWSARYAPIVEENRRRADEARAPGIGVEIHPN